MLPALMHTIVDQFKITKAEGGTWRWVTNIIHHFFIKALWRPHHVCANVHGSGNPHSDLGAIFSDLEHTHITGGFDHVIVLDAVINDIAHILAVFHGDHRFCALLIFIDSNMIVDAFFILEKQHWSSDQTAREQDVEFFCTFWYIDMPFFSWLEGRISDVCRNCIRAALAIFPWIHDIEAETIIHLSLHQTCHPGVFLLWFFIAEAGYNARNFCIRSHRAGTISDGFIFFVSDDNEFYIDLCRAHVDTTRGCPIDDVKIRAIGRWWPCAAWPVPYEGFFTSFCSNVPHLFCVAMFGAEVQIDHIQIATLTIECCDTMGGWISTGCKSCPLWWSNSWQCTKERQVFTARAHFDQFFNVWHDAHVNVFSRQSWVHGIYAKNGNFFCFCHLLFLLQKFIN